MRTTALPFRLALASATGLLLLGGVVGAATVDDDTATPDTAASASSGEAATSTTAAGTPNEDTGGLGAATAQPGSTTTTTITPAGGPATSATAEATTTAARRSGGGVPGPLVTPKVGAYVYDATTSSGGGAPSTTRVTVTVEAAGSEGATTLQDITIPTDQFGQRSTVRSRVAWGAAGAIVRRSQASGADCVWQPAWPQYVSNLKVGSSWSIDTRCPVTMPVQATIERRGSRRVTGTQTVAAAGRSLPTWTIAVDETTTITTTLGVFTVRSVGTEQLAPSLGVPVSKTEALSGTSIPPGSTSTLKLVSIP